MYISLTYSNVPQYCDSLTQLVGYTTENKHNPTQTGQLPKQIHLYLLLQLGYDKTCCIKVNGIWNTLDTTFGTNCLPWSQNYKNVMQFKANMWPTLSNLRITLNLVLWPALVCFWTGMIFRTSSFKAEPKKCSMISASCKMTWSQQND